MLIIDVHGHVFPNLKNSVNPQINQKKIKSYWGRMISNTMDETYIPLPDEEVSFRIDDYGNYNWIKLGKECWMKRMSPIVRNLEWPPKQMIACMDEIGVDKMLLQSGYMDKDFELRYFDTVTNRWPDRFMATITIDYDIRKSKEHREKELEKMKQILKSNKNIKAVYQAFPQDTKIDDKELEPLWIELIKNNIPHFFHIGFQNKEKYIKSLQEAEKVFKKYPNLIGIINHLGGNIRYKEHRDFTDGTELLPILKLPNVYFEVGYVLAYENFEIWKENFEYPYPLHTKLIKMIYEEVGCERLVWGSDMPNLYRTCTYRQILDLIRLHFNFLNEKEKKKILGENALKIFK